MKVIDVIDCISSYAQDFIREYENPNLSQDVIDAIVVDFINFFSYERCGMDLAMYTDDLRAEKEIHDIKHVLDKEILCPALSVVKCDYDDFGIIESINRNDHMNNCKGKAEADNEEALKVIDAFIDGFVATCCK